jgi:hypothetical protein
MFIYYALYLVPALASLAPFRLDRTSRTVVLAFLAPALVAFIGLREQIGHDWYNYIRQLYSVRYMHFWDVITQPEPAFALLNWLSLKLNVGVYGTNLVCASIFVVGLLAFCRRQPNFWMTLALTIPILLISVAMSGVRQATAIGVLMLAFNAFRDRKLFLYLGLVATAFLFHRSAAVFFLFALFIGGRFRILPLIAAGVAFVGMGIFFLQDAAAYYQETYIGDETLASAGALPRAALSVAAAALFLVFRKQWREMFDDHVLFTLGALVTLLVAATVPYANTAADRMLYYLIPLQVATLARLAYFWPLRRYSVVTRVSALSVYLAVLYIWLSFSPFAMRSWIPYRNVLF